MSFYLKVKNIFKFPIALIFLFSLNLFPQDSEELRSCEEMLRDSYRILSEDIYINNPDLEDAHNTPTKKKIFEKSNEFKALKLKIKEEKKLFLKCQFNYPISWENVEPEFNLKQRAFLIYNGYISAEDIVSFGKGNSKGIIKFSQNNGEVQFNNAKFSDYDDLRIRFEFPRTIEIGEIPGPVGLYNAGRNYVLLDVKRDELVVEIENCIKSGCDLSFIIEFEVLPDLLNWKYGSSPFGYFTRKVVKTKNVRIKLLDGNRKEKLIWKGK